jgi:4-carboxymuconolactone decarboxylase
MAILNALFPRALLLAGMVSAAPASAGEANERRARGEETIAAITGSAGRKVDYRAVRFNNSATCCNDGK